MGDTGPMPGLGISRAATPTVDSLDSQFSQPEFPYPATKLIIGTYFWIHPTEQSWACLVVGSFYDAEDRELSRTELLLGRRVDEVPSPDQSYSEAHFLETDTHRRNSFAFLQQDLVFTEDGYLLLSASTRIDIDSYPFVEEVKSVSSASLPIPYEANTDLEHINADHSATDTFAAMAGRGGWNPSFGWDTQGFQPPVGQPCPGTIPTMPYGGYAPNPMMNPMMNPMSNPMMNPMMNTPSYGMPGQYPQVGVPGYQYPQYGQYPAAGYHPNQRMPQPHPLVSMEFPGMNMVNSTGGAGCEPGYNYLFHDEHTKIHVFRCKEPPWRAPMLHYSFAKFQIPTNTTIRDLMARLGAFNPDPRLNRITEVTEGGSGDWYRGMILQGDQEDLHKTLKDIGWDASRNGREKPVVWLWVTKD
ncbi:hypothetical protein NPX13_g4853 [Xylaria arbuscula]|uniref:Uncharacterized protein n=1 Tax=Xylaria arbuscula TaxID=114810 RepID=A0A9W8NF29_9PEZI|nr:hypothetical protein NPX13_g4853 [Xylaria arbuscula]